MGGEAKIWLFSLRIVIVFLLKNSRHKLVEKIFDDRDLQFYTGSMNLEELTNKYSPVSKISGYMPKPLYQSVNSVPTDQDVDEPEMTHCLRPKVMFRLLDTVAMIFLLPMMNKQHKLWYKQFHCNIFKISNYL